MKTFVVLESREQNKTVLVEEDEYDEVVQNGGKDSYWFVSAHDAKRVGEVKIDGDVKYLHTCYLSD